MKEWKAQTEQAIKRLFNHLTRGSEFLPRDGMKSIGQQLARHWDKKSNMLLISKANLKLESHFNKLRTPGHHSDTKVLTIVASPSYASQNYKSMQFNLSSQPFESPCML